MNVNIKEPWEESELKLIAEELNSTGIVFESEYHFVLGIGEISNRVIRLLKEEYNLPNVSCSTFPQIDWDYFLYNTDILSYDEAKKYAIKKKSFR